MKKYIKGFTLIELMIVMTVIAILAAMVLFGLGAAQKSARDVQREAIMRGVQNELQSYASDNGGVYPATPGSWSALWGVGNPLQPYKTTLTDPGCGSALTATQADVNQTSAPCGTVSYSYTKGAGAGTVAPSCTNINGYYLTLVKESGGTQYFCSPQ